jgi:DNA-binding response OmpR family regulator
VLIVVDEEKHATFLSRLLSEEGYTADLCTGGEEAVTRGQSGRYSLILLDWTLPDLDGLSVCRELRQKGVLTPILMLTARRELQDRVLALDSGVDDYVLRPFEVTELLARIRALLRRSAGLASLRAGPLEFDRVRHVVLLGGDALSLTLREYGFLLHLMHRINQTVTRAELLIQVWNADPDSSSNVVEVMVTKLREKLGKYAWMLQTVRGSGYGLRTESAAPTEKA